MDPPGPAAQHRLGRRALHARQPRRDRRRGRRRLLRAAQGHVREAERDTSERVQIDGRLVEGRADRRGPRATRRRIARVDDSRRQVLPELEPRTSGRQRVKIWSRDGTILYSDEPALIGKRFGLGAEEQELFDDRRRRGGAQRPDQAREPLRAPGGQAAGGAHADPHAERHAGAVRDLPALRARCSAERDGRLRRARAAAARRARRAAAHPGPARLVAGAGACSAATASARCCSSSAIEASDAGAPPDRRRPARRRRAGPRRRRVRARAAGRERGAPRRPTREAARCATATRRLRQGVRDLRTLLVEIHPPSLESAGLRGRAAATCSARCEAAGIETELHVDDARRAGARRRARLPRRPRGAAQRRGARRGRHGARRRHAARAGRRRGWSSPTTARGFAPRRARAPRRGGPRRADAARGASSRQRGRHARRPLGARRRGRPSSWRCPPVIRVLLADDHGVIRDGLGRLIDGAADMELVGVAADGEEAVERARELPSPTSCSWTSTCRGSTASRRPGACSPTGPETAVLVLTSFSDRPRILGAIEAGACGYLLKDVDADEVAEGIRAAARGESPLDPRAARTVLTARAEPDPLEGLSAREREVLGLLRRGAAEQADRPPAGDQREDGEVAPDAHLPRDRRHRPHAGGAVGRAPRPRARRPRQR